MTGGVRQADGDPCVNRLLAVESATVLLDAKLAWLDIEVPGWGDDAFIAPPDITSVPGIACWSSGVYAAYLMQQGMEPPRRPSMLLRRSVALTAASVASEVVHPRDGAMSPTACYSAVLAGDTASLSSILLRWTDFQTDKDRFNANAVLWYYWRGVAIDDPRARLHAIELLRTRTARRDGMVSKWDQCSPELLADALDATERMEPHRLTDALTRIVRWHDKGAIPELRNRTTGLLETSPPWIFCGVAAAILCWARLRGCNADFESPYIPPLRADGLAVP